MTLDSDLRDEHVGGFSFDPEWRSARLSYVIWKNLGRVPNLVP